MTFIAGPGGAVPIPAPTSWSEIAAYERGALVELSAWDRSILRKLDAQAVRIAMGGKPDHFEARQTDKPSLKAWLLGKATMEAPT